MEKQYNQKGLETSAEFIMPLPLTQKQIADMPKDSLTTEVFDDTTKGLYPSITLPDNLNLTVIPIIPGITLYSYIRFFHAVPNAGPVDIYVNGRRVAKNLDYRHFTEYMKAFPGYYRVAVFPAGNVTNPLFVNYMNLIGYRIYTGVISGNRNDASLDMINDNRRYLKKDTAYVRFAQMSENAPTMDVYLDDSLVISDLNYKEVSRYMAIRPGSHNIKLRDYLSGAVIMEDPDMTVRGGKAYTVYIVGDVNDRTGLQVIIPLEGTTYLQF